MDVAFHALAPALALLAARARPAEATFAATFAVLPDVDALLGLHRATLHGVLAAAAAVGLVWLVARRRSPLAARRLAALAAFGWASHLLLDLSTGVALFAPFTHASPYVSVRVLADLAGGVAVQPLVEAGWLAAPPAFGDASPLAHVGGTAVTAVSHAALATAALAAVAWLAFRPAPARAPTASPAPGVDA